VNDAAQRSAGSGNDDYQHPTLRCDLVMKGGITSGITYPMAVCEIAKTYRVRNVGGTSAGAMAAAAAAAAEVGRAVPGAGYERLAQLPARLSADAPVGEGSVMFNLFQPAKATRPLFRILSAGLRGKGSPVKLARYVSWAILAGAPVAALIGSALGLATLILSIAGLAGHHASGIGVVALWFGVLAGLLLAVIGAFAGAATSLALRGMKVLPQTRYGICSGFAPGDPAPAGTSRAEDLQVGPDRRLMAKPLTTWLADELDAMAGKTSGAPLTLQDLANAGVNLKMFTTNLTDGTPYTIPFRNRMFFFSPDEFRELFPPRVVDWMVSDGVVPTPRDTDDEREAFAAMRRQGYLPLPDPANMPVVAMARLSLSFPGLMCAVPLWAMRLEDPGDEASALIPTRCWFSDGGIASNFPIHFFDGPLPRWPTFGINLGPEEHLKDDQCENVWSPMSNEAGISARWTEIDGVIGFGHAIIDTMQNWMDNAQTRVPGYRDRIVVIKHSRVEGGMNLNMDPRDIARFSERGRCAGEFLVNRFAHDPSTNPDDQLSWSNHRWLRFRSVMPLVEQLLLDILRGYEWPPEPTSQRTYAALVGALDAPSYGWDPQAQRDRAVELTGLMLELVRNWGRLGDPIATTLPKVDLTLAPPKDEWVEDRPFAAGAPRPRPVLRIMRDF
jgi:hypothetical protein